MQEKKRNKKKNCIRYNLQFIYEYVQIVLTHTLARIINLKK